MMGTIRLSDKSRGWRFPRAVLNRFLHCAARYVPMMPSCRARLHRWRGVRVGRNVFIGSEVFIDDAEPDLVVIEDEATLIARSAVLAHAYYPSHLQKYFVESGNRCGVTIKRGAYIGFGAVILPGVTVGEEAVVAAGALVTRDVPPRSVVMGIPGRVVRMLDETPSDKADSTEAPKGPAQ